MDTRNSKVFEKHVPKYPLPDEILNMEKDETVCHFCGVSYLIHSEIKKLEDRIREYEAQLKDYQLLKLKDAQFQQISAEQNLKIQDLEEKLLTRVQMISSLNNDIESKELDVNRLRKKNQDLENENNLTNSDLLKLKKKMLIYESVVKETMLNISQYKSELKRLQLTVKDQKSLIFQYVANAQTQITTFISKSHRESSDKTSEFHELKTELDSAKKRNNEFHEEIEFYKKQIDSFHSVKKQFNSQIEILSEELSKTKNVSLKCLNLEKENRKLLEENSDAKNEIKNLQFKQSNSSTETNELRQKLNEFQETVFSMKSANDREIKIKNEEIQRLRHEIETAKRRFEDKDKFEKEILTNHQQNLEQLSNLKYEIKKLHDELIDLQNEKSAMILAHQCQITQLKDSFKEKLRMNDDWPEKLAAELSKEREKHSNELQRLKSSLTENFQMELEIQKQKYNEMYEKYQQISKDFEVNSKSKILDLENEKAHLINELRNLHEEKLAMEKKLKQDLDSLKNITKELHQRLEKHTNDDSGSNNLKLREEMIKKDTKINDLENKLKSIEGEMESSKEEIRLLQETVHHECLERDELLEKLEETRNELLELKKNAYTSQQIIPIKASLNKSNINSFKNGTGLIDVNNGPEKITNSYPKNLNEINNSTNNNNRSSSSSQGSGRRNSTAGLSQRTPSDKSSAESSAKVVEPSTNRKVNLSNRSNVGAATLANNKFPTEPIELFKKINEISRNTSNKPTSKANSLAENKKRISLLLTRKN